MKGLIESFSSKVREALGDNIVFIGLFGSKARGDFNKESDIDILIVVREKSLSVREEVFNIMFEVDPWYEQRFSPNIMSLKEYQVNKAMDAPFIEYVEKEGAAL